MRTTLLLPIALSGLASAHGSHSQKPIVGADASWMERHMAEEHHIDSWDAGAFFALHDYNSDGAWQGEEIMRTYGLMDPSNKDMSHDKKLDVLQHLMGLLDTDHDGEVSGREFKQFIDRGNTLPDMGTGPGHHGDDEYEYEIHHWEKYHDENTKLEDLTHPEDIEHFKHHEAMELAEEAQAAMDKKSIIEENIPAKFRRQ
ncbi:EF-Hand 1, calcium-binding site [Pochonia chlamydosporia 170]|uniref:EF-Hand 1, calcium-binding site n=1 Tax=Pochonia chlamydosporia 170 TaxID=1380566 RepID=A0A179F7D2_METCM|nr:EF-Hand 1, calcium-binding site [Pochonia chlamydosporia 170]OAQ61009.1 EF-Hand 1, calcium-binding site [Pochonia chlamydosporia 170]